MHDDLHLHIGEVQTQAHMRAATEGHPGETVARLYVLGSKSHRIEPLGFRPIFRHMVRIAGADADLRARRNVKALESEITQRTARDGRHGRDHPQCLLEEHLGQFHPAEIVIAKTLAGGGDAQSFGAQFLLPLGLTRQIPHHARHR